VAADGTVRVTVAAVTDAGAVRATNEDTFLVSGIGCTVDHAPEGRAPRALLVERIDVVGGVLLGVYDGSGHASSGLSTAMSASRRIASSLAPPPPPPGPDELAARLALALRSANEAILALAASDPRFRGVATTATAAGVLDSWIVVAHVGDTRAYLLRDRALTQITCDDTLIDSVARKQTMTRVELADFPHKHVLTRLLGVAHAVEIPVSRVQARRGDVLVLTSNGLHEHVPPSEMRALLLRHRDPGVAARVLTDQALRAGATDNLTVLVARLESPALTPPEPGDYVEDRATPGLLG
jgi:protein phosphatase